MSNKTRLDVLLVEQGLLESRQKAQAVIMAGSVFVDGQRVDKPGTAVPNTAAIQVRGHALPYVSRGGLKLEKAMQTFPLTLDGKVCADIGASTGGFTDCMLQNGATKVYAVDVGYGQLDWKLRGDPRVVCMERTNARYLTHEQIPEELDFASVDVSFISLRLILPALDGLLSPEGEAVCLVKPQFEAGREKVGKKAWSGTRRCTWRCWRPFWSMQRKVTLQCLELHTRPYGDPRETSNIWAICATDRGHPAYFPCRRSWRRLTAN